MYEPSRMQLWTSRHPRLTEALRAAVAAALAWTLVEQIGGFVSDYPYYAPLGAVIAVSSTVAASARTSLQGVLAILLGAGIALAVQATGMPVVLELAIVVAVGTLLGGLPQLGAMSGWVPIAGLFVLIVGRGDPFKYSLAYLGLMALGVVVGTGVNLLLPPLPLLRTASAEQRLRATLADQLDALATGLLSDEPLSGEEWDARRRDITPLLRHLDAMLWEVNDARRANWRVRRWREVADRQRDRARALRGLSLLVEDLAELLVPRADLLRVQSEDGSSLRPFAARSLQAMAALLRSLDGATARREPLEAADRAVDELASEVLDQGAGLRGDGFLAATIVTSVRRAVAALAPPELEDRLPSHW